MFNIPRDEWVPRFAMELRKQLPELSGHEALSLAVAQGTYRELADLAPEQAVEIYLLEEPPGKASPLGDGGAS